jgi:hypothetical protein
MPCPFCATPVAPGSRFCPNCGTAVVSAKVYDQGMKPAPVHDVYDPEFAMSPYAPPGAHLRSYGPMAPATNGLAIGSVVCGILAWVGIPILMAVVAVVLGHMARGEIRRSGGRLTGNNMALTGMVLGYMQIGLVVLIIGFVAVIGLMTGAGSAVR